MSGGDRKHIYPFRIITLDESINQRVSAAFGGNPSGLVSVNHFGFRLPASVTLEELEAAYNYPLDRRDVWIVAPPKCGNTWSQEMVWLLANDLDYQAARCPLMPHRWNFLDWDLLNDKPYLHQLMGQIAAAKPELMKNVKPLSGDPNRPSPKFVKSHLPLSMNNPDLLDTCKVFYVARNPKDVCISMYKHCRLFKNHDFQEDLESFMELFMAGNVFETPLVPAIIEAWNLRHHPNMCLVFFEDLKRDLPGQLRRMAKFLGKSYSDADFLKLEEHLHIDNFRRLPHLNMEGMKQLGLMNEGEGQFLRKGETGDWKNHFSPEMNARFDAWMKDQLKGTDLKFVTEL